MSTDEAATPPQEPILPIFKDDQAHLVKLRRRLEEVFRQIYLAHDVTLLVGEVCANRNKENSPEIERVLRECGTNRLFSAMKNLTFVIEKLGASTEITEDVERHGQEPS